MDRLPYTLTFAVTAAAIETITRKSLRKDLRNEHTNPRTAASDVEGIADADAVQLLGADETIDLDPTLRDGDAAEAAPILSILTPVYNEAEVLPEFHRRTIAVLEALGQPAEIVYVNDGSNDSSMEILLELRRRDDRVSIVNLSRNFGKEIAVTAGLDHVRGEVAIVIDSDLQDPPELIPQLIVKWGEGYDVVYARRRERQGETWLKRHTASMFYRAIHQLGEVSIPRDTGDFRLLNRRCLDALAGCRERRRFMKGLFAWIGFRQTEIVYDRASRFAGITKWNYWRLWNFALEGITSFTIAPLKFATYSGLVTALLAFLYGAIVVGRTLYLGRDIPGYASLMAVILFLAGMQLTAMGIIGEYVGRIFVESKGRPLYLVDAYLAGRHIGESITAGNSQSADHQAAVLRAAPLSRASGNTYHRQPT